MRPIDRTPGGLARPVADSLRRSEPVG